MKIPSVKTVLLAIGLTLAVFVVSGVSCFALFNYLDYRRFQRAIHPEKVLGEEGLRRLAEFCGSNGPLGRERVYHSEPSGKDIPEVFKPLNPISVNLATGCTEVKLYEQGDMYVYLRVETYKDYQEIITFTNAYGDQRTVRHWNSNHTLVEKVNPSNRILTVRYFHWEVTFRDWIVLPDEIRVVGRSDAVGQGSRLIASFPLKAEDRSAIETAIHNLSATVKGRMYEGGPTDGFFLEFFFARDGKRSEEDIELHNHWQPEVGPLVEAISKALPPEFAIRYETELEQGIPKDHRAPNPFIRTWRELDRQGIPASPWWRLWSP